MEGLDELSSLIPLLPAALLPFFFLTSAALEYVVPPYWGDLFMLLGFFLAGQGQMASFPLFTLCVLGSTAGAAIAYGLGRRYGLGLARRLTRIRRWKPSSSRRADRLLGRFGAPILAVNRFLPIIRGLMLYGAGALRLSFGRSMVYTFFSNLAWIGLLWLVALFSAGSTWSEIVADFQETSRNAALLAFALLLLLLLVTLWRERREPAPSSTGG